MSSDLNPFETEYVAQEVEWFGVDTDQEVGGAAIRHVIPSGRLDDFLNQNFRSMDFFVPYFVIDEHCWMVMTPMELQSSWVPIQAAHGTVVNLGLGMGYTALRMAAKSEVDRVIAVESNADAVALFHAVHSERPEYAKVEIRVGDARKLAPRIQAKDKPDFWFVDIYSDLLPEELLDDASLFIGDYGIDPDRIHFWGQEKAFLGAMHAGEDPHLTKHEQKLLGLWMMADGGKLRDLRGHVDSEYCLEACEYIGRT